ncbi:MAG: metalloregulator ArsR/SmtB family transcription factor [Bacteroidota bacterium]
MKKPKTDVFTAIGDPTRRKILLLLTAGSLSINMLADNFTVSRPAVSKHIKALQEAGLIAIEENGRERYCSLDAAGFSEIRNWLDFYENFWAQRMDRFGSLLKKQFGEAEKKMKKKHKKKKH